MEFNGYPVVSQKAWGMVDQGALVFTILLVTTSSHEKYGMTKIQRCSFGTSQDFFFTLFFSISTPLQFFSATHKSY
jgi:hypothetical protein